MSDLREVTVLGSTGSIGRQAIAVAEQNPDRLRITGLAAGGADVARLAEQALSLGVRTVAVARATAAWVAWWNTRRLHGALGHVPPAEYERRHGAPPAAA